MLAVNCALGMLVSVLNSVFHLLQLRLTYLRYSADGDRWPTEFTVLETGTSIGTDGGSLSAWRMSAGRCTVKYYKAEHYLRCECKGTGSWIVVAST